MKHTQQPAAKQSGVALITALLVVALATIIAVNITERQQYDIRRMQNLLNNQQAYYYAIGGEAWAKGLLYKDYKDDQRKNGTDNLYEDWAQPLPVTLIENGALSGSIIDLQGLFNINNLYIKDPKNTIDKKQLTEQTQVFNRLLTILEINASITDAIIDWLDNDAQSSTNGAEDDVYLQKTPAYRAANQMMNNVSELLLIEGVNIKIYNKLRPFITALPEITTINVNTAPAEVIAALSGQLTLEKATNITEDRGSAFNTTKDFIDDTKNYARDKNKYEGDIATLIGVTSGYFQVNSEVKIDTIYKQLVSTVKRNTDGSVNILTRAPKDDQAITRQ